MNIKDTYGYQQIMLMNPKFAADNEFDKLTCDEKSLDKIRELKNTNFNMNGYILCAFMRDIENNIVRGMIKQSCK